MENKMKCEECNQKEGIIDFSLSATDFAHGFVEKICRQCYIKRLEDTINSCKEQVLIQKTELKKESKK